MPQYMKSVVSADAANRVYHLAVLWDDDDLRAVVCSHTFGSMPSGHQYDPEKVYVTDEDIDRELALMGFTVVGKDAPALAWGERIVRRMCGPSFFDPRTWEWYHSDPNKRSE